MSAEDLSRRALAWEHWKWLPGSGGRTADGYDLRVGSDWMEADERPRIPTSYILDGDILRHCDGLQDQDFDGAILNLEDPATQGNAIELIARHNHRKSKSDALRDIAHAMGRGLSMPEAIVFVMEECP
jgi:hypothetical protein